MYLPKSIVIIVCSSSILLSCSSKDAQPKKADAELYPSAWADSFTMDMKDIAITLGKNEIIGCGEFYYKQRFNKSREFLVACTRTEGSWKYYLVWPNIDEVTGPMDLDSTITPPK